MTGSDDALIERIAEAIYAAHGSPSGMMPTYLADARAVYDVAYPAIRDETLAEVADSLINRADRDHDMNCTCQWCNEDTGILIAAKCVESLRSDNKEDEE